MHQTFFRNSKILHFLGIKSEIYHFEQNSVDPFDSGESDIDDSGPEDDPPIQRIVDIFS